MRSDCPRPITLSNVVSLADLVLAIEETKVELQSYVDNVIAKAIDNAFQNRKNAK